MSATGPAGMVARETATPHEGHLREEVRRADWRFLLDDPVLGDVAYLAPHDPELVVALRHVSASLTLLDGAGARAATADVVIVGSGDRAHADAASALLRPGGWLYIETAGRRTRAWRRTLRAAGLDTISSHWLWPSASACREIPDLDAPVTLRHVLGRRPRGARARLATALARAGVLRYVVPAAVLARRPGAAALTREARVVLTPRFQMSRHIVTLHLDRAGRPDNVTKTPRLVGDDDALRREVDVLRGVQDIVPGSTPRVIAFHADLPHPVLVQSALVGQPLRLHELGPDRDATVGLVADWLARLAGATAHTAPDGAYDRLVAAPLHALRERAGDREIERLVDASLSACAPLRDAALPAVLEHGDLAQPNVLTLGEDRIGVLDWETGRRDGLPVHDLFFFLGHVAQGPLGDAYAGPSPWAALVVERFAAATGVDTALLGALHVACWARSVAALAARGSDAAWLTGQRHTTLWREAVEHSESTTRGRNL